ncbi:MAG TPA: chloride channel protein [Polyangia bacterium]|nr:chloride channel protein [Polyangia bacterium]
MAGGLVVVAATLVLKAGIDFVTSQRLLLIILLPALGLTVAALVLHGIGTAQAPLPDGQEGLVPTWRTFPHEAIRADISADVVDTAGAEERFPWRLAPLRTAAILATVGLGNAMGTEAPAAYLGVATGACVGDRGKRWRRLLRPAALAGGAAGVGALMGIALVGTAFMLELGSRKRAELSADRVIPAVIGGFIGWGIDAFFGLSLIRLVVPRDAPGSFLHAVLTAVLIGAGSGAISGLAGLAVYQAKKWHASPLVRLVCGVAAVAAIALLVSRIAAPSVAAGPGTGAILWAESVDPRPLSLLVVCLLRAAATVAAVAAGGCGGVFVPFLAVGDLAGRVFAPGLGVSHDLAGASGAAGGIAGGYRLPVTAAFMVLGVGGPPRASLTCLGAIVFAWLASLGVEVVLVRLSELRAGHRAAAH